MRYPTAILSTVVLLSGCAAYGVRPGDMTVAEHEATARTEDRAATAQAAQYDPAAKSVREDCDAPATRDADVCWASVRNPTTVHLARAEQHRKLAAEHRAASQALREAEVRACDGVSELDRLISPFEHREEIARIDLVDTNVPDRRVGGAVAVFRSVPGLDADHLQRLVDCHLARNAALGHAMPGLAFCPLVLKGVEAHVVTHDGALGIEVTSSDPDVVHEIVRRSLAILSR